MYNTYSGTFTVSGNYVHTVYLKAVFTATSNGAAYASGKSQKESDIPSAGNYDKCWARMSGMTYVLSGSTFIAAGSLNYTAIAE